MMHGRGTYARLGRRAPIVIVAACLAGCATMNLGRTQVVRIESTPPGARVHVQPEGQTAVTPALVELARKRQHMVTVERDGYEPVSVDLRRGRSPIVLLNFLWLHPAGIIAGFVVDMSNGSAYVLQPDHVSVTLAPLAASAPPTARDSATAGVRDHVGPVIMPTSLP